jgi:asparagine synthase (glutamine-hydrolysing)
VPLDWRFGFEALSPELLRSLGRWGRQRRREAAFGDVHADLAREFAADDPPFVVFRDLREALRFSVENYGLEKLLRAADRSAMAFSREVRLPFLSPGLAEFVFSLPSSHLLADGWNKYLLRRAMEPVLPRETTWRVDKLGFRPPQEAWLKHPALVTMVSEARAHLQREGLLAMPRPDRDFRYLALSRLLRLESLC